MINGKYLLASWGKEQERKNTSGGKKKRKKIRAFATPRSNSRPSRFPSFTVYQRIELTKHIGPQRVYVSRASCIIVLQSQGSD